MRLGLENLLSRRRVMTSFGAGAAAALISNFVRAKPASGAAAIAQGRVVEDGPAACGLSGVMVSNGCDVSLTDGEGRWSLPVRDGGVISVIKPARWKIVSQGHYLHQPLGTPESLNVRGPRIAATGPLPQAIDFKLAPSDEPLAFDVLMVADPQPANPTELNYALASLRSAVEATKPAFAISHGDVMADDLTLLPAYLDGVAETACDFLHCPGNHDMNLDAPDADFAFEAWKRYIGPTQTALHYAGATFILLNNVAPLPRGGRLGYRGEIGDDQLRFVANVLKHTPRDNLIVLSMHIPLASFEAPTSPSDTTVDRDALLALLDGRPHTVSFSGHAHTTEHHYLDWPDGRRQSAPHHHHVLTAASGSWWSGPLADDGVPIAVSRDGTPKGYHVLSVDGRNYTTRFMPFDKRLDPVARTFAHEACREIVVDVFDGGPRTRVSCEVAGAPRAVIDLQRIAQTDPYVVDLFARYPHLCKPWVAASKSSHIWSGALPDAFKMAPDLLVNIVDEYGRAHQRRVSQKAHQPA